MKIRGLQDRDIPQVITLGELFHQESQYRDLTFEPGKILSLCGKALMDPTELGLVALDQEVVVGILGAYIGRYEFGQDLLAFDRIVYVRPSYRGSRAFVRMVREYVQWARSCGVKQIFLSQSTGLKTDRVSGLFRRLRFEQVGGVSRMRV